MILLQKNNHIDSPSQPKLKFYQYKQSVIKLRKGYSLRALRKILIGAGYPSTVSVGSWSLMKSV